MENVKIISVVRLEKVLFFRAKRVMNVVLSGVRLRTKHLFAASTFPNFIFDHFQGLFNYFVSEVKLR